MVRALTLLSLSVGVLIVSCGGPTPTELIVGSWKLDPPEIADPEAAAADPELAEIIDGLFAELDISLSFRADGKCVSSANWIGGPAGKIRPYRVEAAAGSKFKLVFLDNDAKTVQTGWFEDADTLVLDGTDEESPVHFKRVSGS
ncbi:MAG: hypothetical protein AAF581_01990 [Planctomycetota bacterium]